MLRLQEGWGKSACRMVLVATCWVVAGAGAEGALLSSTQHSAWRQFWGLEQTLAHVYRFTGMSAYEDEQLEVAAYYLGVAADFLPGDGEVLGRWGFALKQIGQYELALDALQRATAEDAGNFFHWWWLGDAQRLLGDYGAALESLKTARDLAPVERRSALSDFADFTAGLASGEKSWQNFDRHRAFATRHGENRRYRRQMVELHMALAQAPEPRLDDLENRARLAHTTNNIGTLHMHLQEHWAAVPFLLEARELYGRDDFPADVMRVTQNLALAHEWLAEQAPAYSAWHGDAALDYWTETLALAEEIEDSDYIRYARGFLLAAWARHRSMDDPVFREHREANKHELPWSGPVNDYTVAAVCEGELYCRWQEGDYAGARILAEMMLPFLEQSTYLTDGESRMRIYLGLARGYLAQEQTKAAKDTADLALRTLQELRGYMDAAAWLRSRMPHYFEEAVALAVESRIAREDTVTAVRVLEEAAQSRVRDVLNPYHPQSTGRSDHLSEGFLLRRMLPALETLADATDMEQDWLDQTLAENRARLEWLENHDPLPRPSRLSLAALPPATAPSLQARLGADEALGYFVRGRKKTMAVIVRHTDVSPVVLEAWPELDGAAPDTALMALRDQLKGIDTLYLVPDRQSGKRPWEAFLRAGSDPPQRLVRLLAGSALLWSEHKALAEQVMRFDGEQTELAFREMPSATGRVLFHGTLTSEQADPMLQAMGLTADPQHDGLIYAAELPAMTLPPSLIALAPSAWVGDARHWNPLAFQAGFWHAGASGLIAPLWPVSPASAASLIEALADAPRGEGYAALRAWQDQAAAAGDPFEDWAAWAFFGFALE